MIKRMILAALSALLISAVAKADPIPSKPDDIIGEYYVAHQGEESRVKIFKADDGTYSAQVVWIKDPYDKNGNKRLDPKNKDKSLRDTPCDQIVIVWGMSYNTEKSRWDGGKVYDPTRGIVVNAQLWFDDSDGELRIRGSFMGISETVVWARQ